MKLWMFTSPSRGTVRRTNLKSTKFWNSSKNFAKGTYSVWDNRKVVSLLTSMLWSTEIHLYGWLFCYEFRDLKDSLILDRIVLGVTSRKDKDNHHHHHHHHHHHNNNNKNEKKKKKKKDNDDDNDNDNGNDNDNDCDIDNDNDNDNDDDNDNDNDNNCWFSVARHLK